MATTRKSVFRAELQDGHKGPALIVPLDPALECHSEASQGQEAARSLALSKLQGSS